MAFLQDAMSVPVVGALGSKVSLLDLLKQQYGDDFSTLQSVQIQCRISSRHDGQRRSYWDQANHQITTVLNGGNPIPMDANVTVTKDHFANVQIQVGNNIASNVECVGDGNHRCQLDRAISQRHHASGEPGFPDRGRPCADCGRHRGGRPIDCDLGRQQSVCPQRLPQHRNRHRGVRRSYARPPFGTHRRRRRHLSRERAERLLAHRLRETALPARTGRPWCRPAISSACSGAKSDGGVHTVTVIGGLNADSNHPGQIKVVDNANGVISEHWVGLQ